VKNQLRKNPQDTQVFRQGSVFGSKSFLDCEGTVYSWTRAFGALFYRLGVPDFGLLVGNPVSVQPFAPEVLKEFL
jgi:hypothetical protein